jgi:hypothetical protein
MKLNSPDKINIVFENVWKKDYEHIKKDVFTIWKKYNLTETEMAERIQQIVFAIKNNEGSVVGISTAFKAYIPQLRNYFYGFRCVLEQDYRIPGLTSKLLVMTRDYLESIYQDEEKDPAIGLITIVENQQIKQARTEAVWPASKMVYIGNTKEGHHIRVYYFKGVRIKP